MTALRVALQQRRFELFHASLVICGIVIGTDPLLTLLSGPESIGNALFDVLGVVAGVGFAGWGVWEWRHRDREEWANDFEGYALAIWLVVGAAAVFVGVLVYAFLLRL